MKKHRGPAFFGGPVHMLIVKSIDSQQLLGKSTPFDQWSRGVLFFYMRS